MKGAAPPNTPATDALWPPPWYVSSMEIEGLGEVRASEPERVMLRMRGSAVTVSGWRIAAEAPRGAGNIVLAEHGAQKFYRGEGAFLGWPQERLEAAYRALLPPSQGPGEDHMQLG